jgi:succinate dehydrogenase/fumarate reductase flavoprotein subunit
MHNVLPNSRSFIYHLERRARAAGVTLLTGFRVSSFLRDENRIAGVKNQDGKTIAARRAVILAAGDFTSGADLKARFMGPQEAKVEGVNVTATGDGQAMAEAIGAQILNGDLALGPELRFIAPAKETLVRRLPPWPALAAFMEWSMDHLPATILRPFIMQFLTTALAPSPTLFEAGALLVNQRGERFGDECDKPAWRVPDQPGKVAYIVLDQALAERYSAWPDFISTAPGVAYAYIPDYRRNRPDVYTQSATVEKLALKTGMDPATLARSVAGAPRKRLERGPYIALGPVRSVFVHAEGGLAVDAQHRVLGAGSVPIPGLYAAGSTGQGGLLLKGHGHHLAWAFVSGRRAGRFAATSREGAAGSD